MNLQYQPVEIAHAGALQQLWSDPEVVRYTNMQLPCTLADAENRIRRFQPLEVFSIFQGEDLIGIVGCPAINQDKQQYGFFYQLRKDTWGQENATRAAEWMLHYMEEKYENACLFADVIVENAASEKILCKLEFEQISEEDEEHKGMICKIHHYQRKQKTQHS